MAAAVCGNPRGQHLAGYVGSGDTACQCQQRSRSMRLQQSVAMRMATFNQLRLFSCVPSRQKSRMASSAKQPATNCYMLG